jgi:hypothetical protein
MSEFSSLPDHHSMDEEVKVEPAFERCVRANFIKIFR